MLRRVRDFAQVIGDGIITKDAADQALLPLWRLTNWGWTPSTAGCSRPSSRNYGGGPVGLETLAATIGEEAVTLEDVYEPYLLQIGFLARTPPGPLCD